MITIICMKQTLCKSKDGNIPPKNVVSHTYFCHINKACSVFINLYHCTSKIFSPRHKQIQFWCASIVYISHPISGVCQTIVKKVKKNINCAKCSTKCSKRLENHVLKKLHTVHIDADCHDFWITLKLIDPNVLVVL